MATDILAPITAGAKGLASGLYSTLFWGALILALAATIWFVWWRTSFNRKVLVNYETKGGQHYYREDWAKLKRDKSADYWKLRGMKKMWLAPPGNVVRISKKGRFVAECDYKEGDDMPSWILLKDNPAEPLRNAAGQRVNPYQARFAAQDRALEVEQLEEANNRTKNLLNMLLQLAPGLLVVIIFVVVLVFWGNIWEPMKASQASMAVISQQQAVISEQNARLFSVLAGKLDKGELLIKQVVPADAALFGVNATGGTG
jgi:hypothetical protein